MFSGEDAHGDDELAVVNVEHVKRISETFSPQKVKRKGVIPKSMVQEIWKNRLAPRFYSTMMNVMFPEYLKEVSFLSFYTIYKNLAEPEAEIMFRALTIYHVATIHEPPFNYEQADEYPNAPFKNIKDYVCDVITSYLYAIIQINMREALGWLELKASNSLIDGNLVAAYLLKDLETHRNEVSIGSLEIWLEKNEIYYTVSEQLFLYVFGVNKAIDVRSLIPYPVVQTGKASKTLLSLPDVLLLNSKLPKRAARWTLAYMMNSSSNDWETFKQVIYGKSQTLIVIQDSNGDIFGMYAAQRWYPSDGFYGNDKCFLFTLKPDVNIYEGSGRDDNFQIFTDSGIGMGGKPGNYGLLINMVDKTGSTSLACSTFRQFWPLARNLKFKIEQLEVWMVMDDSVRLPDVPERTDKKLQLDDQRKVPHCCSMQRERCKGNANTMNVKARCLDQSNQRCNIHKSCQCCAVQRSMKASSRPDAKDGCSKKSKKCQSCAVQKASSYTEKPKICQCCTMQRNMKIGSQPHVKDDCKNKSKQFQCCSVERRMKASSRPDVNGGCKKNPKICQCCTMQRNMTIGSQPHVKDGCKDKSKKVQCCTVQRSMEANSRPDVEHDCKKISTKCETKRDPSPVCETLLKCNYSEHPITNSSYFEASVIVMESVTRQNTIGGEGDKDRLHPPIAQSRHYKSSHVEGDRGGFVHPSENPDAHLTRKREKRTAGENASHHPDSIQNLKPKLGNAVLNDDGKQDNPNPDPSTNSTKTSGIKRNDEKSLAVPQDNSSSGGRGTRANESEDIQAIAVPVKRGDKSYVDFQVQVGENKISVASCRLTNRCACAVRPPCSCSVQQATMETIAPNPKPDVTTPTSNTLPPSSPPNVEQITPVPKPQNVPAATPLRPTPLPPNPRPANSTPLDPPPTTSSPSNPSPNKLPTIIGASKSKPSNSIKIKPASVQIEQPLITGDKKELATISSTKIDEKTRDDELPLSNEINESPSDPACRCSCTTVTSDLEMDSLVNPHEISRTYSHCSCNLNSASNNTHPLQVGEKSLEPSVQGLATSKEIDISSSVCSCELGTKDRSVPNSPLNSQRQLAESCSKKETQYLTQACTRSVPSLSPIMNSMLEHSLPPTCLTCRSVVGSTGCHCKTPQQNTKLTPILEEAPQFQQQQHRHSSILKSEQKSGTKSGINRMSSVIINTQDSPNNMSGSSNCSCAGSKPKDSSTRSCRCKVSSNDPGGRCMCKVKNQVKKEESRSESTTLSPGSKEVRISNAISKKCQCSLARSCFPQFPEELLPNSDRSKTCGCCSDTNFIRFPQFPDPDLNEDIANHPTISTLSLIASEENSAAKILEKQEGDHLGCSCVKEDGTIIILNVAKCNTMQAMEKIIQELDVKFPTQLDVPDSSDTQIEKKDMNAKPCTLGEGVDREALKRLMDAKMKEKLKEINELKRCRQTTTK